MAEVPFAAHPDNSLDRLPIGSKRDRHCEEPDRATKQSRISEPLAPGLLRFARNDGSTRSKSALDCRALACRIACLIALGAMLAGCDKCGDWWYPGRAESQVCRDQAPRPQ
jgi:hypothetical protein